MARARTRPITTRFQCSALMAAGARRPLGTPSSRRPPDARDLVRPLGHRLRRHHWCPPLLSRTTPSSRVTGPVPSAAARRRPKQKHVRRQRMRLTLCGVWPRLGPLQSFRRTDCLPPSVLVSCISTCGHALKLMAEPTSKLGDESAHQGFSKTSVVDCR